MGESSPTSTPPDAVAAVEPVIRLDGVSKRFGDYVAVESANFDIGEGEFFSMLGPSGCGKTTTLRMIAGFEQPTGGRILLDGVDVSRTPPYKRDVNTVFQNYALFPHMNVFDNVAFGLRNRKTPESEVRTRVSELLEVVRLPDMASRRPNQLSGGQQQRIALARALVNLPKALLLDEPLGALDLKLREVMQLELKRLQHEVGITFIMVTHDQEEALTMSDRIVVMERGRVAQDGRPQDIYDHPASPYVANFIGTTNFLPATPAAAGRFRVAGGELASDDAGPAGGAVTLGFRPEKARFLAPGETAPNMVEGRVAEVIYYGLGLRTAVDLGGGASVFVDCLLPDTLVRSAIPQPGTPARVAVEPHNVFVFAGEVRP